MSIFRTAITAQPRPHDLRLHLRCTVTRCGTVPTWRHPRLTNCRVAYPPNVPPAAVNFISFKNQFGEIKHTQILNISDVWLTVHRSPMWNKKPTRCHLVLSLFLLYKLLNMFRATLCPSSAADDLVVFFHVWCSAVAANRI